MLQCVECKNASLEEDSSQQAWHETFDTQVDTKYENQEFRLQSICGIAAVRFIKYTLKQCINNNQKVVEVDLSVT